MYSYSAVARTAWKLVCFAVAAWLLSSPAIASAGHGTDAALVEATRASCGKQIVLIGEADHGDGATVEFKADLVQRLVSKCGFKAVYLEAGTYDFLRIGELVRSRQPVTPAMLSSAIGALWNRDEEMAPLVKFLLPRVNSGEVRVGGIDDQIGAVGAFYSLDQMPADLAAVLPEPRRSDCRDQMRTRANYAYSDEHPHNAATIASLDKCLAEVERHLRFRRVDSLADEHLQMSVEFRRAIARDFVPMTDLIALRDRGMYLDLRWLMDHAGDHRKVIIWCANAHAGKSPAVSNDYPHAPNLGTLVRQAFGSRAFALGISAADGSHYWSRKEPSRPIPQAAPGSVEAQALAGRSDEAVYLSAAQLRKLGAAPGSFDKHQPHEAHWDQVFDGAVILPTERPPTRT